MTAWSVGVVLADPRLLDGALAIMRAARGEAVLFLMHDGVLAADDSRVDGLLLDGHDVIWCAMDAEARGVLTRDGGPTAGSQYDHAVLVRDAHRVVTFTRQGRHPTDSTPRSGARRVLVEVAAPDALASGALRAAMAFGAVGLDVSVVAPAGFGSLSATAERARTALGERIRERSDGAFDVVVGW